MLKANKDFSELAKTRSTGPSGPSGGNLGWFSKGMMVPPFEKAVLGLKVGEISDPIQTQFGWHIIKLIDVREKAIPSLEEVRPEIEQSLRQEDVKTEIQNLTSKTEVIRSEICERSETSINFLVGNLSTGCLDRFTHTVLKPNSDAAMASQQFDEPNKTSSRWQENFSSTNLYTRTSGLKIPTSSTLIISLRRLLIHAESTAPFNILGDPFERIAVERFKALKLDNIS